MAGKESSAPIVRVTYEEEEDTLIFLFPPHPTPAIAEEIGDDVWVRYDLETNHIVTLEVLHFSSRIKGFFGPSLTYTERGDEQRIPALYGLPVDDDTS
jgi:hypothetical protein